MEQHRGCIHFLPKLADQVCRLGQHLLLQGRPALEVSQLAQEVQSCLGIPQLAAQDAPPSHIGQDFWGSGAKAAGGSYALYCHSLLRLPTEAHQQGSGIKRPCSAVRWPAQRTHKHAKHVFMELVIICKALEGDCEAYGLPEAGINEIANAGDNRGMHAIECCKEPVALLLVAPQEEVEVGRLEGVCHVCHGA